MVSDLSVKPCALSHHHDWGILEEGSLRLKEHILEEDIPLVAVTLGPFLVGAYLEPSLEEGHLPRDSTLEVVISRSLGEACCP